MKKKIVFAAILIHCCSFSFCQTKYADSLRGVLTHTTNAIERFDLLNNIVLDLTGYKGDNIDSAATMQMLQIAQDLHNDSLKAISYNWIGSIFYLNKGDNATALEYFFKALPFAEKINDKRRISSLYFDMSLVYFDMQDNETAVNVTRKGGNNLPDKSHPLYDFMLQQYQGSMLEYFVLVKNADSAIYYAREYHETITRLNSGPSYQFTDFTNLGAAYAISDKFDEADKYFSEAIPLRDSVENSSSQLLFFNNYLQFLLANSRVSDAADWSRKLLIIGIKRNNNNLKLAGAGYLRQVYDALNEKDSAYYYSRMEATINAEMFSQANRNKVQALIFNDQLRNIEEKNKAAAYQNQLKQYGLMAGLAMVLLIAFMLFRNNRQKQKTNKVLETTLSDLKSTQTQLIQSEKMASLGELTAGIAHEIQNPLNFVNNFSEVNKELLLEMKDELRKGNIEEVNSLADDVIANEEKINHHGKRADAIVKGMLQHSRSSSGIKEPTDINALCDEYLRLSYHGLRARDKSFNATMKSDFDASLPNINVLPQDIGRVVLNLLTNAFYAVDEKKKLRVEGYEPTVTIATRYIQPPLGGQSVEIKVSDNGGGIPQKVLDKIFQPFFTTKPTGQGTGLGLSLSYDIIKAHGGEIKVETSSTGSQFAILLPINFTK